MTTPQPTATPTTQTPDVLRAFAHVLRTLDPNDNDWSDLAPLGTAIGDARIVCIGESTHLNREFYLLKDRLFRYLASEHGFTAFVLESGFPEGWAVDEWVQGGPGDLAELSRSSITYGLGDCDEMRALLQWMRERNASASRKLRFYGADLGGSSANPGTSVRAALARLSPEPGDAALRVQTDLGPQHDAMARWLSISEDELQRIGDALRALVARADASGDELACRFAESASISCAAFSTLARGQAFHPGENARDRYMAETVRWVLEREPRIVVAAHDAHIQRTGMGTMPSLGSFLSTGGFPRSVVVGALSAHGEVVKLAIEGGRGVSAEMDAMRAPPDGIESLLAATSPGPCLYDLTALPAESRPGVMPMLGQNIAQDIDIARSFDLLVDVGPVTVVDDLLQRLRSSLAAANAIAGGKLP